MSDTWGPRAHPERCCEDIEPDAPGMAHRRMDRALTWWAWLMGLLAVTGIIGAVWMRRGGAGVWAWLTRGW